ncbi:MAG: UDP-N-acetylmuramoyl-tripeptide--D-alanyl-D-alanine ligase [Acidobacteria bacterium]|nr:UDP-N-acetylmuramoyl-tripeptide--D-alanyl-D-alanine ligase [Acidobacteriota bacterium]
MLAQAKGADVGGSRGGAQAPLGVTVSEIAAAVDGRLASGRGDRVVDGFSIDSRTLSPGDLFFAIQGERVDGHAFVGSALERGACGVVVRADAAPRLHAIVIAVDDTTRALQRLARHIRRLSGARVVAITGSAGKTTTKELTAELLSSQLRVYRNRGNLNNHIGLPLSLLDLRHRPDVAVVEFGMNHAGEIRTLVGVAEPEVRVWTNVGEAHAGFFESIDAIADAKAEILEAASPDDLLVANADDARVISRAAQFAGRVITFGMDGSADVCIRTMEDRALDGFSAVVRTPAGEVSIHTPLVGRGNLANALAAIAVATDFGVALDEIARRLRRFWPAPHRGEVLRLGRGIVVLDDSYNSNPTALRLALDLLRASRPSGRRIAVVGEMLELGRYAFEMHEASGRELARSGIDRLVAVGGAPARALANAAVAAGMAPAVVTYFGTSDEAADAIGALVGPGDVVLVKGSRGIRADKVVDRLKAELA